MTGRGSCRDFVVLMIEAVRALGLAARFVSGYLHIPTEATDDFQGGGNTHAWCQVYLPGAGWVEFDPTNGIVGNRNLIRVAVARDPRQAPGLLGLLMTAGPLISAAIMQQRCCIIAITEKALFWWNDDLKRRKAARPEEGNESAAGTGNAGPTWRS